MVHRRLASRQGKVGCRSGHADSIHWAQIIALYGMAPLRIFPSFFRQILRI